MRLKWLNSTLIFVLYLIILPSCKVKNYLTNNQLPDNLETQNLVAWCIVPFDARQRGPEARAKMLKELGILRCAYDWREKHVPEFEEEILQYQKHGIEYFAFWGHHEKAFELFKKYGLQPQIWYMIPHSSATSDAEHLQLAVESLEEIAGLTQQMGCKLGLYNHGGWEGEPQNLVAVCKKLRERGFDHVGIVYNWHHAHEHIHDWAESLKLMKPYLHCVNLNGMSNPEAQPKILPLAQGRHEQAMLKILIESGYQGPIGIIDHLDEMDTRKALQDNLKGMDQLKRSLAKN